MQVVHNVVSSISSFLWSWPLLVLLLGTHIFLTIRLKFPQRYIFKGIKLSAKRDEGASGEVSQFGALATSLAATIGTGNIVGVALAISLGGPGAVFWCWIAGIFGIATKYSEGLLAVKYREITPQGKVVGGPMYALEKGLKKKWLAVLFSIFGVLAGFGIGNMLQANSITVLLNEQYHLPVQYSSMALAVLVALVIMFGLKGIAKAAEVLVPFMAGLYVLGCLYILGRNGAYLGESLKLIISSAFTPLAAGGGFAGATVMAAFRFGISRGVMSNESGLGSAAIAAAAAQTRNPVRQALVSSTSTFWDTVVLCALTGLVLVSTMVAPNGLDATLGPMLTRAAFSLIPVIGPTLLTFALLCFAFTTVLGWSYYAEKCIEYLGGRKVIPYFRVCFVIIVYLGGIFSVDLVWDFADIMNAFMAIPNLICLLFLSGVLVKETQKYLWSNRLDDFSD